VAVAGFEVNPDWQPLVLADWADFADSQLGGEVADDARRYCPVRTGALKASIEHHMDGDDLVISATGGGEDPDGNLYVSQRPGRLSDRSAVLTHPGPGRNQGSPVTREVHHVDEGARAYALWVEEGHAVHHPSTGITGPERVPPQPFLRPALYQHRGG
jgi:hypothetical protein